MHDAPAPRATRRRIAAWTIVGAALVAAGVLLAQIDLRSLDAHVIAERVRGAGPVGPVALFLLLVVQCVASPLPSEPLMMAAGFLYGPWAGFALSWVSVVIGATLCFLLARRFGRPVAERFAPRDKLDAFDAAFAGRGMMATFVAVLGIRLVAHGSFDLVSYACGLIPFSLPLFLVASGVGVVPKVFAFTYLGASAGDRPGWLDAMILVGTLGMLLLVPLWMRARRKAGASPSARPGALVLAMALAVAGLGREAGAATATAVAAGDNRTCAVTGSSGLRCWGVAATGDGSDAQRRFPVEIGALAGRTASVSVGRRHVCAVTTAGGVECWGGNTSGQIGVAPSPMVLSPTGVAGLATTASAVAIGHDHTCALLDSGDVQCWGANDHGQLGDGTTDDSSAPVTVVGLGGPVARIVGSTFSTCALSSTGGVKCWGSLVGSPAPVDYAGLTSGIADIAFGSRHTCLLTSAGGVACFGQNDVGQLGDGTTTPSVTPVGVTGLGSGVIAIDAAGSRSCALTSAGALRCWGGNDRGQIGDGSRVDRNAPVDVVGLASGVVGITTGAEHTCAAKSDGALLCWGNDFYGATGTGWWYAFETRPDNVVDFGPPVCAILDPGQIFASRPTPRLVVKQGKFEIDLALTASVEFALPAGVSFADLDPQSEGLRLQIRDQVGVVRVDARLHGGAYEPVSRLGWQRSGSAWTFRADGLMPFGVTRVQISDRSRGAPGGRVRVIVRAMEGLYPVDDQNDPVELTVILGDDASAAAGKCGRSAYAPGQCTENEPGTALKCK